MVQYFKGDDIEKKYYEAMKPIADQLSQEKTDFFDECFDCHILGDILWESNRSPLANAIEKDIFREVFSTIFDSFLLAGSFESYLTVFRKVFGEEVEVVFTVPAPGKLVIDITSENIETSFFITRYISENTYNYDRMITSDGDNLVFGSIKGFESQYELEKMLFEMVPAGIFTDINLTIGA